MSYFKLIHSENSLRLLFDTPDSKANIFNEAALDELEALIIEIKAKAPEFLRIESAKKNIFIAGADISEISNIESPEEAELKAKRGQDVFNLIEDLPFPTLACVRGACLGGGLELALACDYILASDHKSVRIGLPEVNLGILPGFGGCYRMPRKIGISKAIQWISAGKMADATQAFKARLVDQLIPDSLWDTDLDQWAQNFARMGKKDKRFKGALLEGILTNNSLAHKIVESKAREQILKKTKGHYPAPIKALETLLFSLEHDRETSLSEERRCFATLAPTQICKNLIQVHYNNEAMKKETWDLPETEEMVKEAAVLGAGTMGGGIAWLLAYRDIPVRMKDLSQEALNLGYKAASEIFKGMLKRRKLNARVSNFKMNHISGTIDYSGFSKRDLVVEAVIENLNIKKQVLQETETKLKENALLVTNTSSLSIDEMAEGLARPQNFAGLHFFNPVHLMPLVEIIPGAKTSPETLGRLLRFSRSVGKMPLLVKNVPGFLINRILIPYMNEAARILGENGDTQEIDFLIKEFGMPMGPFELADEVGIDVGFKVSKILEDGYGKRMAVAPMLGVLYEEKILGKKNANGFYLYDGKSKKVNPKLAQLGLLGNKTLSKKQIVDRCILMMVNEAALCLSEGVVSKAQLLDMGMLLGTGFPPFRTGPLAYADQRGIAEIYNTLTEFETEFGERFKPASILKVMADQNDLFYNNNEGNHDG